MNRPSSFAHEHLLHRLYRIQQQCRHIPPQAMQQVAIDYQLPLSQVAAVVEFYAFFSTHPRGRFDLLFSNCTSCGYLADGENLLQILCQQLQVIPGKTRADGLVSIGEASCIGTCDHGPSMLVNGFPVIGLNAVKLAQVAQLVANEIPLPQWPAAWLEISDTVYRRDLLLSERLIPGSALQHALRSGASETLMIIQRSGLRGRGGAGFDTGKKWQLCREAAGETRYVVCNADEGEPGTFKDRLLLHEQAGAMLEGMTLCARIIGAQQGFVYLRGEYRYLLPHLQAELEHRRKLNLLGVNILGQIGFDFDIDIVIGAGAYICGEESALIESLEGKPGIPRIRPPFPVTHGYLAQPTVVNNIETFIAAAQIAMHGADWFKTSGTSTSSGSKLLSISGDCEKPGIYEYPFGVTIRQVLGDCGAADAQAVQIGGPAGTLLGATEFERTIAFDDVSTGGSVLIFGQSRDLFAIHRNFAHFFAHESCGFCAPCRIGTQLLKNSLDTIAANRGSVHALEELQQLGKIVKHQSHCGLGHTAANHVLDGLRQFPQAFSDRLQPQFTARFDLDQALADARQVAHRDDAAAHLDQKR
ncbi:NAD(P)H-dependent oxidoreductase subunit E [Nitrosomonas sp.]|uniref:NAD(P)H-dependent oxidoreductase subunit E n=1 Tax=Nitrosomonas sp. TaxID=42353 RepID=UPI0025E7C1C5|nr:NAD(P)H-dependent oxidoreductase subunit E [Nitrosomonas sp.]